MPSNIVINNIFSTANCTPLPGSPIGIIGLPGSFVYGPMGGVSTGSSGMVLSVRNYHNIDIDSYVPPIGIVGTLTQMVARTSANVPFFNPEWYFS